MANFDITDELCETLYEVVNQLSSREILFVSHRVFGNLTYDRLGSLFGVSRGRAQAITTTALMKTRRRLEALHPELREKDAPKRRIPPLPRSVTTPAALPPKSHPTKPTLEEAKAAFLRVKIARPSTFEIVVSRKKSLWLLNAAKRLAKLGWVRRASVTYVADSTESITRYVLTDAGYIAWLEARGIPIHLRELVNN